MKSERNSSFELLRLLCIFGILVMHSFGRLDTSSSLINTEFHVLYNSLFNTGVSCFILISGYFGIRFDLKKLIRLDMMVIFFTMLGTIVLGDFGIKDLIKACIPVISRRYWFISCYFALCLLAPFLNQIPERLERAKFRSLLLVLLLIFSFIPTITTYDIMQDAGKGLAHFVMIYLIGRYLAKYFKEPLSRKWLMFGFCSCILTIFVLDSARTMLHGVLYSTFARDCSALIILASVLLLLWFRETSFKSAAVNHIAGSVLAVTVLDAFIQSFLNRYFDWILYQDSILLPLIVPGYALAVMVIAILLNELRVLTIGRIEPWLSEHLAVLWYRLQGLLLKWMEAVLSLFVRKS